MSKRLNATELPATIRRQLRMNDSRSSCFPLSTRRLPTAIALAGASLLLAATSTLAADAPARMTTLAEPACWTYEPGVVGAIDHPTDPTSIVLRMFTGGGFVPVEIAFMENPVFTLYGNDVAVFRPAASTDDITDPLAPYLCTHLNAADVDELLAFALDEGGLREAGEEYRDPFIADTPNTIFTIDADGVDKDVFVAALGYNPAAPDQEARESFQALADLLTDFEPWVETSETYEAPLYRGLLSEVWVETPAPTLAWPWEDLPAEAFSGDGFATAYLRPEQVAEVAAVPNGGQGYIVLELSDGSLMSLAVSPLLPEQVVQLETIS